MGTSSTPATTAPQSPATPDASSAPTTPDVSAGNSTTAASPSIFDLLGSSSADKSQAASAIPSLLPTSDVQTQPTTTSLAEATNATPTTEIDSAQPNTLSPETVSQADNTESTLNATVTDTPSNSNKPDQKAAPAEKKADAPQPKAVNPKPEKGKETQCAPGSKSLGVYETSSGKSEMCALIELKSSGEESTPGSDYYMKGAKGHAIVRASISANYVALINDAQKHGIKFQTVNSSFRTEEHQADLYYTTKDHRPGAPHKSRNLVAPPKYSEHNVGDAIDFHIIGADSSKCVYDSDHNCTAPHDEEWQYLAQNADKFHLGIYKLEAWHVDNDEGHWATYNK